MSPKILAIRGDLWMFLQMLKEPILLEGQPAVKDLQLNLVHEQRQFRLKCTFLNQTSGGPPEYPTDIVVYNYSDVRLGKFNLSISFNGRELLRGAVFRAKLSFDFLRRKWKLSGNWNERSVDRSFDTFLEILPIIQELAMY